MDNGISISSQTKQSRQHKHKAKWRMVDKLREERRESKKVKHSIAMQKEYIPVSQ